MPKLHQEKRTLVENLIEKGYTKKQICFESGIPIGSIDHYLRMWGLRTKASQMVAREKDYSPKRRSKYDNLKDKVKVLIESGEALNNIAIKLGIPKGSITFLAERWGLSTPGSRIGFKTQEGQKLSSEKIRKSHQRGRQSHPLRDKISLHGNWVSEDIFLSELKKCLDQDMTYEQMEVALGTGTVAIWKVMKRHDLLRGHRSGARDPKFRGGHKKYRGPDWYKNRRLALERDNYTCQDCGQTQEQEKTQRNRSISVHHKIPYEISQDSSLPNLVSVCQHCHMVREHKDGRLGQRFR